MMAVFCVLCIMAVFFFLAFPVFLFSLPLSLFSLLSSLSLLLFLAFLLPLPPSSLSHTGMHICVHTYISSVFKLHDFKIIVSPNILIPDDRGKLLL